MLLSLFSHESVFNRIKETALELIMFTFEMPVS